MFQKIGPSGYYHQELWQLTVCLASSSSWSNIPLYTNEEIERYGEGLWIGNEPQDVSYDYGHIMRHRYGDQIEAVLNKWKDRRNSLHTVISLWSGDSFEMWAAPCLITIHLRIRDDDILDMYVYFRANEMYKAWPKNIAGLRYLQTRFVEVLNVSLGELTMTSGSAHLFEHDLLHVDSYLKRKPKYPHDWDAKGNWHFRKVDEQLIAEHYKDGRLLQTIYASSVKELEQKVLPFISSVSHALYIGKQLSLFQ